MIPWLTVSFLNLIVDPLLFVFFLVSVLAPSGVALSLLMTLALIGGYALLVYFFLVVYSCYRVSGFTAFGLAFAFSDESNSGVIEKIFPFAMNAFFRDVN